MKNITVETICREATGYIGRLASDKTTKRNFFVQRLSQNIYVKKCSFHKIDDSSTLRDAELSNLSLLERDFAVRQKNVKINAQENDRVLVCIQSEYNPQQQDQQKNSNSKDAAAPITQPDKPVQYEGEIVSVIERNVKTFSVYIKKVSVFTFIAIPFNKGFNEVFIDIYDIPSELFSLVDCEDVEKHAFEVECTGFDSTENRPRGRIVSYIGKLGEYDTEIQIMLVDYQLKHTVLTFDEKTIEECKTRAKYVSDQIDQRKFDHLREDLTFLNVISIDPVLARDRDDALSLRVFTHDGHNVPYSILKSCVDQWMSRKHLTLSIRSLRRLLNLLPQDCLFEIGVHIADVSLFVTPEMQIERYVHQRPTTIYHKNHATHMLPEFLSTDLLSLNCNGNKVTATVLIYINKEGEVIDFRFCKGLVNVKYALYYDTVADFLQNYIIHKYDVDSAIIDPAYPEKPKDTEILRGLKIFENTFDSNGWQENHVTTSFESFLNNPDYSKTNLKSDLCIFLALSRVLYENRKANGSFTNTRNDVFGDVLASPLSKQTTHLSTMTLAQELVAEFMILCNTQVACFLKKKGNGAVLRTHSSITATKFESFVEDIKEVVDQQIINQLVKTRNFSKMQSSIALKHGPYVLNAVENILVSSFNPAKYKLFTRVHDYFCLCSAGDYGHSALAVEAYSHFTSPIRRYADILTHRLLFSLYDPSAYNGNIISNFVDTVNKINVLSQQVKRMDLASNAHWVYIYQVETKAPIKAIGVVVNLEEWRASIYICGLNKVLHYDYFLIQNNVKADNELFYEIANTIILPTKFAKFPNSKDVKSLKITYEKTTLKLNIGCVTNCYVMPSKLERYKLLVVPCI